MTENLRRSCAALTALSLSLSGLAPGGTLLVFAFMATSAPCCASSFNHAQRVFIPPGTKRYESLNDSPGPEGTDLYNSQAGASVVKTTSGGRTLNKTIVDGQNSHPGRSTTSGAGNVPSSSPTAASNAESATDSTPAMSAFITQARSKAQLLVKQGKLADAEQMLEKDVHVIQNSQALQHELADVRVARARYCLKIGNTSDATRFAESALLAQPDHQGAKLLLGQIENKSSATTASIDSHLSKARVLAAEAQYTEARQEIQAAIKIKDTADGHVALGDLDLQQNNKSAAKAEYARALHLDPQSAPALRQAGILRLEENDIAGANKDLGRALMINPSDREAASALQKIWHEQVAKNPTSPTAHLGLARAYQLSGDLTLAQVEYREVARIDPNNPALPAARQSFKMALAKQEVCHCLEAAQTLEKAGALNEAHQKILEAVGISPRSVSARIYQGTICEKLRLYPEAHEAFMQALRSDPKNAVAAKHLRELAALSGASSKTIAHSGGVPPQTNIPAGLYAFRGWQYGHPLANSQNADVNSPQYQYMMAVGQNNSQLPTAPCSSADSYGGVTAPGAPPAYGGAAPGPSFPGSPVGLSAPPPMSLPGSVPGAMPGAMLHGSAPGAMPAYPADPATPMPLEGVPPQAATTAHVNQISSFLGAWKNAYSMQKKQVNNAVAAAQALDSSSGSGSGLSGLAGLSGLSGIGASGGSSPATGLSAALSAGAGGAASVPPLQTNSIDSILKQAASAVAKAGGSSSSNATASAVSASSTSAGAGSGASSGAASNSVNINVNGTNIQITPPGGATATNTASTSGQQAGGAGMAGAVYDALPSGLKKKFSNLSQQDFASMVASLKAPLKNALSHVQSPSSQSVAAQIQNPNAATTEGMGITDSTIASALTNLSTTNPALADNISSLMKRNNITPAMVSQVLNQPDLVATTPGAAAALEAAEREILAKAGQDTPTLPPPEVTPLSTIAPTTIMTQDAAQAPIALKAPEAQALSTASASSGPTSERLKIGPSASITSPPTALTALTPISAPPSGDPVSIAALSSGAVPPASALLSASTASTALPTALPTSATPASANQTESAATLRSPLTTVPAVVSAIPSVPGMSSISGAPPMSRSDLPVADDNSNAAVVFELQGFEPTPTGVKLRVTLRNSRNQPLPVPDDIRAVVHMPGKADRNAKVSFTAKQVQANGEITGLVRISGHDLNPAADLVLADFLPDTFADRDVHLTVPISALMKFAPK